MCYLRARNVDDDTIVMGYNRGKTQYLHLYVASNAPGEEVLTDPDFNLLVVLDILLAEASVAGAARRLNLSTQP